MRLFKTRHIVPILLATVLVVATGCSTQKNTARTRWWHSFKARYNTYYNGSLAYIDASLEKEEGNKDNFTELIPLYTVPVPRIFAVMVPDCTYCAATSGRE